MMSGYKAHQSKKFRRLIVLGSPDLEARKSKVASKSSTFLRHFLTTPIFDNKSNIDRSEGWKKT